MQKSSRNKSKGQLNIEFLAAAGFFIIAITGLITSNQALPSYSDSMDRSSLNLEAKTITDQLITEPGRHSYGKGGNNWEKNSSTVENTKAVGLSSDHHVLDRGKMERLKTATIDGSTGLNYTEFKEVTGVENQYKFKFVWLPTIQTNHSFIKSNPPSNPNILEPETSEYASSDNRVHYGSVDLDGNVYNVLVTAHNGAYDSLYVQEESWDFTSSNPEEPYQIDQRIQENNFYIESFQNRENDRGALVIISKNIKEFGPTENPETEVITLDRYGVFEGEPMRMEVSAW